MEKEQEGIWKGVDGRRIARYGKGEIVEEQQGMAKGRWWNHSKVCKRVDGGRIARYGQGQMVEEQQGM